MAAGTKALSMVIACAAWAGGYALAASPDEPRRPPPRVQASVAPEGCVCTPPTRLSEPGQPPSQISNCQCGALQCVVHIESGRLSCH